MLMLMIIMMNQDNEANYWKKEEHENNAKIVNKDMKGNKSMNKKKIATILKTH